ncbi:ABC transporter permease subunit [Spirulina sp. CS-785/01]|uniref:ABC transporter permease n=1 Tax=Spirulina sp. CS-785/01 TaxID=3021716 RepID=UPI00232E47C3|nr:ABC transporter permease subunit [Spirulina sp. CS-785/01]MDB9313277.1 ABC transporter permease subunit [Spirulina sp. CS-785/01]
MAVKPESFLSKLKSEPRGLKVALSRGRPVLMGLLSLLLLLLLWQWGAVHYTSLILPAPGEVAAALGQLLLTGAIFAPVGATIWHVVAGFGLAVGVGGVVGVLAGRHPWLQEAIAPLSTALLGTPPIAWLVLAMVWFGLGDANSIFTVAVTVSPMIFTGAVDAIATLDPHLLEVAQVYQLRGWQRFRSLYWPHLLSRLLPLLIAGLGLSWRVSIMSEVLATPNGIGAALNLSRANLDTPEVMAWIIVTIGLVLASDTLLRWLQHRLLPWQQEKPSQQRLRRYCATTEEYLLPRQRPTDFR